MNSFSVSRRTLIVILALAFQITAARAQAIVQWVRVGGTSQQESPGGPVLGHAGEIYLPGWFGYDSSTLSAETVLYKYALDGQQTGSQAWRGENILDLAVDPNGNYFVTGRVLDSDVLGGGRSHDFYLAKYAADRTLLWERTAGTDSSDRTYQKDAQPGFAIALDSTGNICVAGRSTGPAVFGNTTFSNTPGGPLLCKFAPDGTLLWARRTEGKGLVYSGTQLGGGNANSIDVDSAGNVVIAGWMYKGPANFGGIVINIVGTYDQGAFVAKYSPAGQILWAKSVPFGGTAMDGQGNVLINGPMTNGLANIGGTSVTIDDPSGYNWFVAKYDPAGVLLWARAAPGAGLIADSQGNIYSGASKFDPMGNLIWTRIIPGASLSVASLNKRGEPVFTGTITGTVNLDGHVVQSDGDNYEDYVICKADVTGTFQWGFSVTSGNLEPGLATGTIGLGGVLCDRAGNIFVSGTVNCPWSFPQQTRVCGVAMFGDFPLTAQFGGNNDFFLARITDPAPVELKIARTGSDLALSWPVEATNFVLEAASSLPAVSWDGVTNTAIVSATERSVQLPLTGNAKFFRLRSP